MTASTNGITRARRVQTDLTTGDVSRMCGVSPRTVAKWLDTGGLKGYRVPGSNCRRIPRKELVAFLRREGFPLDGIIENQQALLIGTSERLASVVGEYLTDTPVNLLVAATAFDAGIMLLEQNPQVYIVDLSNGRAEGLAMIRAIRGRCIASIIALASEDERNTPEIIQAGADSVLTQPFDVAVLVERIRRYCEA